MPKLRNEAKLVSHEDKRCDFNVAPQLKVHHDMSATCVLFVVLFVWNIFYSLYTEVCYPPELLNFLLKKNRPEVALSLMTGSELLDSVFYVTDHLCQQKAKLSEFNQFVWLEKDVAQHRTKRRLHFLECSRPVIGYLRIKLSWYVSTR